MREVIKHVPDKEEIRKAMLNIFDCKPNKIKYSNKEFYRENDPKTHYEKVEVEK